MLRLLIITAALVVALLLSLLLKQDLTSVLAFSAFLFAVDSYLRCSVIIAHLISKEQSELEDDARANQ